MSNQKWGVWPSVLPSSRGSAGQGRLFTAWGPGQVFPAPEGPAGLGVVPGGGETRWDVAAAPWGCYPVLWGTSSCGEEGAAGIEERPGWALPWSLEVAPLLSPCQLPGPVVATVYEGPKCGPHFKDHDTTHQLRWDQLQCHLRRQSVHITRNITTPATLGRAQREIQLWFSQSAGNSQT